MRYYNKLKLAVTSVILLLGGGVSQAQVVEMYYQGFESGETVMYTASPATSIGPTSDMYASGSRSLDIVQSTAQDDTVRLATLDFTTNTTLQYIAFEFDHICAVQRNSSGPSSMCRLYYKLESQSNSQWTQITSQDYNMENEYSSDFNTTGAFSNNSYSDWLQGTINNESWKSERFDLNTALNNVPQNERKLQLMFVVRKKVGTGQAGHWWIDNIRVRASSNQMVRPTIKMVSYPDCEAYPNSRGARIELDATTSLSVGINPDSVYVIYKVGSDPTERRLQMDPVAGVANRYRAMLPFEGFDTLMQFYCVARDNTTNHNIVTFPLAANSWIDFHYVRGAAQPGLETPEFTGTTGSIYVPFPDFGDNKCEWIYDSALMANAGYKAGSITAMRFKLHGYSQACTRNRLQIRMKNASTDHVPDTVTGTYKFTSTFMKVVYDGPLSTSEGNAGVEQTITLQDTFYYGGKDLVIQVINHNTTDVPATNVKAISAPFTKRSMFKYGAYADYGFNAFTADAFKTADLMLNVRPAFVLTTAVNLPLLYDVGVSALVSPNAEVPLTVRPSSLVVKLKNFGALSCNAVRISYIIDDSIPGYFDWSGNLAGGAETQVTLSSTINIPAGYHTLCAWVEDTLTSAGQRYRDHEPYNDTTCSKFVMCDGALSGVRHIGGATPDYNDIEEFLFSLQNCGIDDSLVVKIAPGQWPAFSMPVVSGISEQHYIVFEPETDNVVIYSDSTTSLASTVDLTNVSNIRFRNITFTRRNGMLTDMVTLGETSHNCHFEGCQFIDSLANPTAQEYISRMINSGFSNGLTVDGCTFVGGKIGVDLKGLASDMLANGSSVRNSLFRRQNENAVSVENQNGAVIEHNEMYDVLANASYVLMVYECYGPTRIVGNKLYTSHGAGAMGVSNVAGTQAVPMLVANNMIVCEDDGSANLMRPPLNIIQADYTDVVYNSVKMNAPSRSNVSAAAFGGGLLNYSRFLNNMVVCLDYNNYAFGYLPATSTTNHVGHNVYYSNGSTLNRMSGGACANLTTWRLAVPEDTASVVVNPNFLNGSLVDLRTYNRQVKGVGVPIASVPTDMFDTVRSTTATCPGAFEFVSLFYDFEPEAMLNPVTTCYMPAQTELVVRLRNSGVNAYSGTGLKIGYSINGNTNPLVTVSQTVPAEDTVTIHTGRMLTLPTHGVLDSVYNIRVWTQYAQDPNATNDTNVFTVVSRYHANAPANVSVSVPYSTPATFTPTAGVDTWSVYNSSAAPQRSSRLYWYTDSTDADPVLIGPSYTTDTLRQGTEVYFRQQRDQAIVRMTQVEIAHANNIVGLTPSMPYWMASGRKVAIQLTNIGDATANLAGDTLQTISPESSLNNKIFVFPDVSIEPGQSLVLQYATGASANPAKTIHNTSTITVSYNKKIAFVLRRGGVIEDAVMLGAVATTASSQTVKWSTLGVPAWVWSGNGVDGMPQNSAGMVRVAFNGDSLDWRFATAEEPMFIADIDPEWIRYSDNGCQGVFATATVSLLAPPAADIELDAPQLPESGCHTEDIPVTVTVHNFGVQPVSSVTMHYNAGGTTVNQILTSGIPAGGEAEFTFAQPITLGFPADSTLNVRVWCDALASDPLHTNDTSHASVTIFYTPAMPAAMAPRNVNYATADVVTIDSMPNAIPVWYDYTMTPVDTGYVHTTDILYGGGTMGVSYLVARFFSGQIGSGTTTNAKSGYPTPYQPNNNYAKQQYIYSAADLRAQGLEKGYIQDIAFNLVNLYNKDSVAFTNYKISMGLSSDTIFANTTDWKTGVEEVYYRAPMTIRSTNVNGWVSHKLDTPFYWDGESSVVVQIIHYIQTKITSGVQSTYTAKNNTTLFKQSDVMLTPSMEGYVAAGIKGNNRPNIKFNIAQYGCTSPIREYQVNVIGIPSVDMAVLWPAGVDTLVYNSCDSVEFYVNLRNQGLTDIDTLTLYYQLDAMAMDSTLVVDTIQAGHISTELLAKHPLTPGRHTLTAIVAAPGDTIHSNDTISRSFLVRFCAGLYTIAHDSADYHSFGEAIDTLTVAGIEGPVIFQVADGEYQEQVQLGTIPGSSIQRTVTFEGMGDSVVLTAANTQAANYVLWLNGAANVRLNNLTIFANSASNVNFGHALVMQDVANIGVNSCHIMVRPTLNNLNGNCLTLLGDVSKLSLTDNLFENGFNAVRGTFTENRFDSITIVGNEMRGFWSQGVCLRGVNNLEISSNRIQSGVTVAGRSLKGLYLANVQGTFRVQKNHIYLVDDKSGGKVGMWLENIEGSASNTGMIVNNMISCSGAGVADLGSGAGKPKPSGIWIDSSSTYVNIYFNSVRVYCGPYANVQFSDASRSFFSGATNTHLQVMNNIFSNHSKGYAYYVDELNTVLTSNYNAYYTESIRPFAWKDTLSSLTALQAKNGDDQQSLVEEPYFVADTDLHLMMTNFVTKAQYNTEVVDDIDGNLRPQIPAPTIGAQEMPRLTHDMTVVRIQKPIVPTNMNFNANNQPYNIEGDSVKVIAQFYNNGRSNESNIKWYAYIEGHEDVTMSDTNNLGSFAPAQMKTDSLMMPTVLGIIDMQTVHVVVICPTDTALSDNDLTAMVYLAPAYNLATTRMSTSATGCKLHNTGISITLRNDGFKDFPAGAQVKIGYHTEITSPANVTISTLPDTVEQYTTLTSSLLRNQSVTVTFDSLANLYPTDTAVDIKVRVKGWCYYQYDVSPNNDSTNMQTSQSPVIDSWYTPAAPVAFDTTFAYGTWGVVRADQINSRPIRWYRDSTLAPYYSPQNFNTSKKWSPTPQYFHDSVYYLNCLSTRNCASYFTPIHVNVAPRVPNDMAFVEVLAPLGGRVYMQNDTVRVRVANYGTSSQSNVPVTYVLKRGNTLVETVTETITETIAPGADYVYTFERLLNITTPTTSQQYSLVIYTDLANDQTRRNDTIRYPNGTQTYGFRSLPESNYNTTTPDNLSFDITRLSFNEIDLNMPPLGRGYSDLASPFSDPDYPVLHVSRGENDSVIIEVTPYDGSAQSTRCNAAVYIDFNRNGNFTDPGENVMPSFTFYNNQKVAAPITISPQASYGYMRMRVVVADYEEAISPDMEHNAHVIDFLLFVDANPPQKDLAVTQIVGPRDYLITDDSPKTISFRVANKGTSNLSNITFHYHFDGDTIDTTATGTVTFQRNIFPGSSTIISLPPHVFPLGTSVLTIWHEMEDDENRFNDTLVFEYNRFHEVTLILADDFDAPINYWYSPTGRDKFSQSLWQRGTPTKTRINAAFSEPNAWVTDLNATVATGKRGNVSYLYSPIINISQIKADTLSFRLQRNLTNGSSLYLEFRNFQGRWVKVDYDSATNWYNNADDRVFDGNSPANTYNRYWIPTASSRLSGDFPAKLQFRFVYTTPLTNSATAAFGEGCAIDDFRIGRAQRSVDAGVIAITRPTAPRYGETIYPEVVVKNYGYDTLRNVQIGYIRYGTNLATMMTRNCNIPPNGGVDTFEFDAPFIVTSDYPDTFYIDAFTTIAADIYRDNDTTTKMFLLSPLDDDISAEYFTSPLPRVIAGDTSITVTLRVRNFGLSPITNATASYLVNGLNRVDEEIDFVELLGRPLQSMEFYNYTFHRKFRATMGLMQITGIIKNDHNDYIYNDTVTMRTDGITSIADLAARAVIVDTSDHNFVRVQLIIDNRGARGANGFEVGFWIDNNDSTKFSQRYLRDLPIPALSTGYHLFDTLLPTRAARYDHVTAYVKIPNDNDPTNDTTNVIDRQYVDIEIQKVIVEETAAPDCRVFLVLRNIGNLSLAGEAPLQLKATINGNNISTNLIKRIEPWQTVTIEMNRRIPKDLTRTYVGTGRFTLGGDANTDNNQTNLIEVHNHVEGVPTVDENSLQLDQNYPNPFTNTTTIPFALPNAANVRLFVVDALGHIVYSTERFHQAGNQTETLDLSHLPSGVYYYGIEVDGQRLMRKMLMR